MAKRQETTTDIRKLVIKLSNEGNSMSKVGKIIGLSKSTIQTIIKNFRRRESYESLPRTGRPSKLSESIRRKIVREVTTQPRRSSVELKNDIIGDYGINVHADTVRRCLKKSGLHTCIDKEKPCISPINNKKRFNYAAESKDKHLTDEQVWEKVIFTDQCKFCLFGNDGRARVWSAQDTALGPKNVCSTAKHGGGNQPEILTDVHVVPLTKTEYDRNCKPGCKRQNTENYFANEDPLKKLAVNKSKRNNNRKEKAAAKMSLTKECTSNEFVIKEEPMDCNENEICKEDALKKELLTKEFMPNEFIIKEEPISCNQYDSNTLRKKNEYCEKGDLERKPLIKEFITNELIIKEEQLDCKDHDSDSRSENNKNCKEEALEEEFITNEFIIKEEPLDFNEYDSDSLNEKNQNCKDKAVQEQFLTEELIIKEEPLDSNEHDSDSISDVNEEEADTNYVPMAEATVNVKSKSSKSSSNYSTKIEEKDKFIAEHLKHKLCDLCQLPLKDFSDVQKHFSDIHSGHRGYFVCCKRKYFRRWSLINHLHSHLNPDHFKCEQCGKVLSDRVILERHIRRMHASDERVKKHSCDTCGKSFMEIQYLHRHKRSHLPEEARKKFKCEKCCKQYDRFSLLHRHIQVVHLKIYEESPQHPAGEKKEYLCSKCPKVYYRPKTLRKHIYNVHITGNDYKCSICAKDFMSARTLKDHMASHTGIRLYACPWCSETFKFQSQIYAHRKKMHPKEWAEAKLQKSLGNLKPNIVISDSNCAEESGKKRLIK